MKYYSGFSSCLSLINFFSKSVRFLIGLFLYHCTKSHHVIIQFVSIRINLAELISAAVLHRCANLPVTSSGHLYRRGQRTAASGRRATPRSAVLPPPLTATAGVGALTTRRGGASPATTPAAGTTPGTTATETIAIRAAAALQRLHSVPSSKAILAQLF